MSNLLPVGPDGETEHGTWCLVGASGMEHKTLFLVKGIPGHINPTTLPDVTCTYLHWQRSHWTSREVLVLITCYYYFFFYEAPVVWQSLRSLGINLLPIGFSRGGACWCFLSHDTYHDTYMITSPVSRWCTSQRSHPGLSSKSLSGKVGSTHCVFSGEDTHIGVGGPVKMGLFLAQT